MARYIPRAALAMMDQKVLGSQIAELRNIAVVFINVAGLSLDLDDKGGVTKVCTPAQSLPRCRVCVHMCTHWKLCQYHCHPSPFTPTPFFPGSRSWQPLLPASPASLSCQPPGSSWQPWAPCSLPLPAVDNAPPFSCTLRPSWRGRR